MHESELSCNYTPHSQFPPITEGHLQRASKYQKNILQPSSPFYSLSCSDLTDYLLYCHIRGTFPLRFPRDPAATNCYQDQSIFCHFNTHVSLCNGLVPKAPVLSALDWSVTCGRFWQKCSYRIVVIRNNHQTLPCVFRASFRKECRRRPKCLARITIAQYNDELP